MPSRGSKWALAGSEALALGVEAGGAGRPAVVDGRHGLVAAVAGQLDLVIFDYILLEDRVAVLAFQLGLVEGRAVEVAPGDEPVVAGDVRGRLGRAHAQLVHLVGLLGGVVWQNAPRVVPKLAQRVGVLGLVVGAARAVRLSGQRPEGPLALDGLILGVLLHLSLVHGLPVAGRVRQGGLAGLRERRGLASLGSLVRGPLSVVEESRVVSEVVLN